MLEDYPERIIDERIELMSCINYAHRGASRYAPENTLAAFYLGIEMGAQGIETDIQRTSDGALVLFHDKTLLRIAGMEGCISDYTYAQLLEMDFGAHTGKEAYRGERIVTLNEFLLRFGRKNLAFALEIKQTGTEEECLAFIHQYGMERKVTFTSFLWDSLVKLRRLDSEMAIGYLTERITQETLDLLDQHRMGQICPLVSLLDKEGIQLARRRNFSVRGWGVKDGELMDRALALGVDGMTVDFPDLLTARLRAAE